MKIGFQIEHLDPARGGAETYVDRFARALLAHGHEVHLFAAHFEDEPPGAVLHRVLQRGLTRPERDWRFARAMAKAARHARLDVVVAVGRTLGANVLQPHGGTLGGSRRQNLSLIRNPGLRGLKEAFDWLSPRLRVQFRVERHQFQADPPPDVIAISRMVRRDIEQFHNVPDERLHLVYNGVDLARFSPAVCDGARAEARHAWGLAEDETCFLIVAHNFRLKGIAELIDAAADLDRGKRWRVVVVGKGKPGPYLKRIESRGCTGRFQFAGTLADVVPAYAAADVYVQPTWYDPCSLVVLEALACGRPVITTRFNGTSELMEDGRDGLVLDTPSDIGSLTQAMARLLEADERRRMGRAARETAEQHSLKKNFDDMMAVFEKAAARKEGGHA